MTADPLGGVWTYAIELARQFDRLGIELGLATMGAKLTGAQRQEISGLRRLTLFESEYRIEWMDNPWDDVARAGEWLLDIEARYAPDVVHLNGYVHGALQWHVPHIVVGHSCKLSWWEAVQRRAPSLDVDEYRQPVTAGLQAADIVVAPTRAMLAALRRQYGELPHAAVIWNARTTDAFAPANKWPIVLAAGRVWDQAKNMALLDGIAPTIPWPVFVAGETTDPSGRQVSLRHATALGPVVPTRLATLMAHAGIYVLPARYEPFGLSILEAALSGCALVLGDIDSLRELWDGVALFVDPDDEVGLGEAIRWLIESPPARDVLAQRARARALGRTPEAMVTAYLATYRDAGGVMVA
ncbi:MAG: glycosyltransferase family 4 protein [Vicinamibacterales bacterium]